MSKNIEVTVQEQPESEFTPAKFKATEPTEQEKHAKVLRKFFQLGWRLLKEDPEGRFLDSLVDLRDYCEAHGIDYFDVIEQANKYPNDDYSKLEAQAVRKLQDLFGSKVFDSLRRSVTEALEFANACNHQCLREVAEKLIEITHELNRLHSLHRPAAGPKPDTK